MRNVEFSIYRLNYVDEITLFPHRIRSDEDLLAILNLATSPDFDVQKARRKAGFRWAVREVHTFSDPEPNRDIAVVTLARSELYRRGTVVTDDGIEAAVSEPRPPLAITTLILIDLRRHLFAVEYSAALMASEEWHKQLERILDRASRKLQYTTHLKLEPVPPREEFEVQFRRFQRVTRLRLTLRIPNPDIAPTFERLYRELERGGVRELSEDMKNTEGLDISGDTLPRASLDMALSGYKKGALRVTGVMDGEFKTLDFSEQISRAEVEGVREYIQGMAAGTDSPEVRKALRAVVRKIDEILPDEAPERHTGQ